MAGPDDDCLHCLICKEVRRRMGEGATGDALLGSILEAAADLIAAAPPEPQAGILAKVHRSLDPLVREVTAARREQQLAGWGNGAVGHG